MLTRRINTAVLISGNGSNLQALIDAATAPDYPAEISFVLSNKAHAFGLTRAKDAGIETCVLSHKDFPTRELFDMAMSAELEKRDIQLICMAGFMRILTPGFVQQWQGKLLNIHPSLLPAYKGLDTHQRVLEAGEREHGATVHWVTAELDSGETIAQAKLDISADDTPESLAQRVHALEHQIYPAALRKVAQEMLK